MKGVHGAESHHDALQSRGAVLGVITKNVSASSLYVRINVVFISKQERRLRCL